MTIILGINAFHGDSSACLVRNGEMICAIEEERLRRIKHWAGFPSESIQFCLSFAGIKLDDVNFIAINQNSSANFFNKIKFLFTSQFSFLELVSRLKNRSSRSSVLGALRLHFPQENFSGEVCYIEHHLAHMASAFYVSPYNKAAIVSVDGFGDFASTAWGVGDGALIKVDGRVHFPHSLGIFYQALTQYIGFPSFGDEYKMMGLASYGKARYVSQLKKILLIQPDGVFKLNLSYFRHHAEHMRHTWTGGEPVVDILYSEKMADVIGIAPRRDGNVLSQEYIDLAASAQAVYEEAFFAILNMVHAVYKVDNLALAGGCAMNSVANGKIIENTPFKSVYIQSAAGDAGGAIGAALVAWHTANLKASSNRGPAHNHAYWGPQFTNEEIAEIISSFESELDAEGCNVVKISSEDQLCELVARKISDGNVIGWFQGRMEWGPRALGNRSIVGDPRRNDMKDILNLKIKRRESFRPFAPSVLKEDAAGWFEGGGDVPFMMQVYLVREEVRKKIPAVTHVDGSGRLQTVDKLANPRYHKLISSFKALTGVPMVLNTSFNENEPIVCQPSEAILCFLRTKMDILVLGDWVISRAPLLN